MIRGGEAGNNGRAGYGIPQFEPVTGPHDYVTCFGSLRKEIRHAGRIESPWSKSDTSSYRGWRLPRTGRLILLTAQPESQKREEHEPLYVHDLIFAEDFCPSVHRGLPLTFEPTCAILSGQSLGELLNRCSILPCRKKGKMIDIEDGYESLQ